MYKQILDNQRKAKYQYDTSNIVDIREWRKEQKELAELQRNRNSSMNYELQDSHAILPDINNKNADHEYYTNQIINPIDYQNKRYDQEVKRPNQSSVIK